MRNSVIISRLDRTLSSAQFTGRELRGMFWTLALDQFFMK